MFSSRFLLPFFSDLLRASFSAGASADLGPHPGANRGTVAVSVCAHLGTTYGFLLGAGSAGAVDDPAVGWASLCHAVRS